MKKLIYNEKKYLFLIVFSIIIGNFIWIYNYILNSKMTDAVINQNPSIFFKFLIIVLIILLFKAFQGYIHGIIESKYIEKLANKMRQEISNNLVEISIEQYISKDSGKFISKYINDINLIIEQGVKNFFNLINDVTAVVLSLLAATYIHWSLLFVLPLSFIIVMIVPKLLGKSLQEAYVNYSDANGIFTSKIKNILGCFNLFIYENKTEELKNNMQKYSEFFENERYKYNVKNYRFNSIINSVAIISNMFHIIVTGILVINGTISAGYIIGVMNLAGMFSSNIQNIFSKKMYVDTSDETYRNIFENLSKNYNLLNLKEDISKISVQNLNYSYEKGINLYNNLSFEIFKGKKYLINGKSGSGKSTLLKILLGNLSDYRGEIKYNDIDLKMLDKRNLYKKLAYVNQSPYILNDSIRYNLIFNNDIDDSIILNVLKKLNLYSIVKNTEKGLDTIINENANNLSGGQKQRISIARALLSNKKFIIIDEGTTGVDEETSNAINSILLEDTNLTVIMINHNLNECTKKYFDDIINI